MGGGMGYIPKPEDLQRQIDYMDTMDMVKRRHQQNAAEAFQQNTMQYPAYANMFGTMLNGFSVEIASNSRRASPPTTAQVAA